jgi:iron complex transport system substrate-binding protein
MMNKVFGSLFFGFALLIGCTNNNVVDIQKTSTNVALTYAKGFSVNETSWGYVVSVFNLDDQGKLKAQYGLGLEEALIPDSLQKIKIPIRNVACLSTTHIPMFDGLNAFESISGVAYANYIKNNKLHELIDAGSILEIDGASGLDTELLLASESEYLMVYPYEDEGYGKYTNYGLQLIYNAEYAEKHPLGKAEWIKFVGLLTNKFEEAVSIFEQIEGRYLAAKSKVDSIVDKPTVFAGSYFKSMWNAPNANSLVARLLEDAGAKYVFNDTTQQGNIVMDKETFLSIAVSADYWGRVVNNSQVVDWPLDYDVLKNFVSFNKKQAFYCDVTLTDYFGVGTIEPDVILKDLIAIFHSNINHHKPVYFKSFDSNQYPKP